MTTVVNISGFGGGYERTCHRMIYRWLKATKDYTFDEVFPEGKLDEKISDLFDERIKRWDVTGAMYGASLQHYAFIKKQGYEAWLKMGEERNQLTEVPSLRLYNSSNSTKKSGDE